MNTIQFSVPQTAPSNRTNAELTLPVTIPDLVDVIQYAKALHTASHAWEGTAFGWPADYAPEIKEEEATFEEYDEKGVARSVVAPRWTPAAFCIGINDLWFVSLTWELGADEEPWIYLEDDYGYEFDDTAQVSLARSKQNQATNGATM